MTFLPPRIKRDSGRMCLACETPLERKSYESSKDWRRREVCDRSCANRIRQTWATVHEMLIHETVVRATTGCWEWRGYLDPKGYGRVGVIDGETLVHRIAYAEKNGPIPHGMHVLHSCDNRRCCNVEHLSLGTNDDNVRDRVLKGRSAAMRGKDNPNYKTGKYVSKKKRVPVTVKAYWDALPKVCVCGKPSEHIHHIIHVNGQRITKDHWLVVPLCHACHNGSDQSVHALGGERQFLQATGSDLVQLAVLHRHNFEVRS